MNKSEIVKGILKDNNGYISTADFLNLNIMFNFQVYNLH